jgi:transposase-like protein
MEKFTADEKVAIVMESFTANNIADLCRRHGVSVASFYKWRDKFIESGKQGFYGSGGNNGYEKEIDKLKKLIGDQALVIDELKKNYRGRR